MNLEVILLRMLWPLKVSSRIDGLFSAVPQVFFCLVFCARLPFSVSGLSNCETWRSRWVIIHRMTINHVVSLKTWISLKRPGVMSWLSAWGLRGQLGAESQLEISSSSGPSCIRVGWWRCKLDFAEKEKCSDLMCENEGLQKQINNKRLYSSVRLDVISAADWADAIVSTLNDINRFYAIYW